MSDLSSRSGASESSYALRRAIAGRLHCWAARLPAMFNAHVSQCHHRQPALKIRRGLPLESAMDMRLMSVFDEVYRTPSVSRPVESLGIPQTSVSFPFKTTCVRLGAGRASPVPNDRDPGVGLLRRPRSSTTSTGLESTQPRKAILRSDEHD